MGKPEPSPLFKPGDEVETPTGRRAKVTDLRADGKRDLEYLDADGGSVALEPEMLKLLKYGAVRPWPSRRA